MPSPAYKLAPWTEVPAEHPIPLLTRQVVNGSQVMLARIELKAGCITARHSHPNEQISCVLQGAVLFHLGEDGAIEQKILHPGDTLVIPPNFTHGADAIEDSVLLDIFAPPRQDWIQR